MYSDRKASRFTTGQGLKGDIKSLLVRHAEASMTRSREVELS